VGGGHKVIFGPQSSSDLQSIVSYVRKASRSPEVAERLEVALVEKALTLSTMPESRAGGAGAVFAEGPRNHRLAAKRGFCSFPSEFCLILHS
jgi:hypothetical protein